MASRRLQTTFLIFIILGGGFLFYVSNPLNLPSIGTSTTSSISSSSASAFVLTAVGWLPSPCYSLVPSGSVFVRSSVCNEGTLSTIIPLSVVPQSTSNLIVEADFSWPPQSSFYASMTLPSLPAQPTQNFILKSIVGITSHYSTGQVVAAGWIGTTVSLTQIAVPPGQPTQWTWLAQSVVYDASSKRYTASVGITANPNDIVTASVSWTGSTWVATTGVTSSGQTNVISVTGLKEWAMPASDSLPNTMSFVVGEGGSPSSCAQYPSSNAIWSGISPPTGNTPRTIPTTIGCNEQVGITSPTSVQVVFR